MQRYDGDPGTPAQRLVGVDSDLGDRTPLVGHLGDYNIESSYHLLLSAPVGGYVVGVKIILGTFCKNLGIFELHLPQLCSFYLSNPV